MLCVLCLIVLWGFPLVTSYSGVKAVCLQSVAFVGCGVCEIGLSPSHWYKRKRMPLDRTWERCEEEMRTSSKDPVLAVLVTDSASFRTSAAASSHTCAHVNAQLCIMRLVRASVAASSFTTSTCTQRTATLSKAEHASKRVLYHSILYTRNSCLRLKQQEGSGSVIAAV